MPLVVLSVQQPNYDKSTTKKLRKNQKKSTEIKRLSDVNQHWLRK